MMTTWRSEARVPAKTWAKYMREKYQEAWEMEMSSWQSRHKQIQNWTWWEMQKGTWEESRVPQRSLSSCSTKTIRKQMMGARYPTTWAKAKSTLRSVQLLQQAIHGLLKLRITKTKTRHDTEHGIVKANSHTIYTNTKNMAHDCTIARARKCGKHCEAVVAECTQASLL